MFMGGAHATVKPVLNLPFSMVPYLPKASARDSSLVSKLSPPMNNLPSSDILAFPTNREKGAFYKYIYLNIFSEKSYGAC